MITTVTYLCGTDYQYEMENGSAIYYDSLEKLKEQSKCWQECGIVELHLNLAGEEVGHRWIEKQKW
jgi:hypothetical protein